TRTEPDRLSPEARVDLADDAAHVLPAIVLIRIKHPPRPWLAQHEPGTARYSRMLRRVEGKAEGNDKRRQCALPVRFTSTRAEPIGAHFCLDHSAVGTEQDGWKITARKRGFAAL
ncbi:MAG: hypothetical protein M3362_25155, partial [Acidobacteriota bacterium]|nr:hypothetical protein [Acidobacteriota bacterium]